jgi:PHD/YefM family antitoxin component YafN of YafNO toxin-antitoxin module
MARAEGSGLARIVSSGAAEMIRITTIKARQEFDKVLRKARRGRRFLLERQNWPVAAIVSVEDLALLEAFEDQRDLEDARRGLAEYAEKGAIPWEQVKAELDRLDAREEGREQGS